MRKTIYIITSLLFLLLLTACGGRSVTIQFDAKGGTPVESLTITQLEELTEPQTSRTGYTFLGWFTEETYENEFDFEEGAVRNITLFAKWQINQYTISFETNNGTDISSITADYQASIQIPTNLTKEGFTFGGWFSDENFDTLFEATRMVANDVTLYAKWNPIVYFVEFYVEDELFTTRQVEHGQTLSALPSVPDKEGYNGSWDITLQTIITENTRADAVYEIKTYTVNFIDQWDYIHYTVTVNHGDLVSAPTEDPVKLGYNFVGYSEDLTTLVIEEDTEIEVFFTPKTYLVTFRVQGSQVKSETVIYGASATAPAVDVPGYTFSGWDKEFNNVMENIEVNAILTPIDYAITLNGNGGLFDISETHVITAPYQSSVTFTTQPTRLGYQFAGWYLNPEGTENQLSLTNYTMPLNGLELYAKWETITYNIDYYNLFGSQNGNPLTYNVTQSITFTDPTSRIGYTFVGWFDAAEGGNQVISILTGATGDLTLYARWEPKTYYINFIADGGVEVSPIEVTYDQPFVLEPTVKVGFTFLYWSLNGSEFTSGTWTLTENITLLAIYKINTYTINFDTAGGLKIADLGIDFGEAYSLSNAEKIGYTFIQWELDGVVFPSTGEWFIDSDITLVAIYEVTEYNINYLNLFDTTHSNPAIYTIESNTITLADPSVRTGYTFAGWYTELSGGTLVTEIPAMSHGDINLYAHWTANTYTITFDTVGGSALVPMQVTYNQSFTFPTTVKDGFSFAGWTLDGQPFVEGVWTLTEDITLVAVWTEWPVINFVSNGGSAVSNISVAPTDPISEPTAPTRIGYTFGGWYTDNTTFLNQYIFDTMPAEDLTLYAKWNLITYDLVYLNLFGTTESNPPTYNIETATFTLTDPSERTGYTFAGWYNQLTGGTEVTQITLGSTGDITLYARWTPVNYSITYENLNGGSHSNPLTYNIETATITLSDATITGYTFDGWFDSLEGGVEVTEIPLGTIGEITLYARWTAKTYSITFNTDGGELIDQLTVTYDESFSLPDAVKTNYNFLEWQLSGVTFTSGTWTLTQNITLVATYEGVPLTVTYSTGGGSSMDPDIVLYGEELIYPEIPNRNGYSFLAWYSDPELATIYDFNNPVLADMTLYAAWQLDFYIWEIQSIFLREDLNDPNIVIIDPNQPAITFQHVNLYYGLERSPVQEYEGYVFDYFIYDGLEYSDIEQLIMVTGNRAGTEKIEVYYRKIILTITFAQDPDLFELDPELAIVSFRVYYNDTFLLENGPELRQPASGLAVWDRTQFTNVRNDIIVYALYYQTGVKTVTFIDRGAIKYIAAAIDDLGDPILEVIGVDSILWDLYRPGYKFLGWYTEETGGTLVPQGDLSFADFVDLRTSLYARWLELTPFTAPTNITVTADETEIIITWDINPATINALPPAGFEFILNNNLITNLTTIPTLSGSTFTLTLLSTNPEYDLFLDFLNPGTHQLSIKALGDEDNHYHSDFSEIYSITIESIFSGDPTEVAVYDYFIIETFEDTKRYIFYTNLEYQFGSSYTFEIVTGQEVASANLNTIFTNGISGSFKFRMIREGYPTVVYDALVVHDIKQFDHGNNYKNYLDAKIVDQTAFLDQAVEYYIGTANDFYLDLRMINNQGSRIPLAQTYLEYTLYEWVSGSYQEVLEANIANYLTLLPDNKIQLTPATIGGTFKLVVEPKYQATSMIVTPLEFEFTVNSGVNVFTNQQLKDYFSDFNVNIINIHSSFKAELTSDQKNADGSPINKRPTVSSSITGNVYQRFSQSIDDDQLTIEGNFMTIDGSELPFSNANSGSGTVGFAQSFEIISVQIGVFFYGVRNTTTPTTNNNQFNFNNLIVKGNTSTPYVDFGGTAEDIEIQERLMSKNSGGYTGVMIADGEANLNNLVIFNTVIAVTNNAYGYKTDLSSTLVNIDYLNIYNSWANSIYLHGGLGFTIFNSEIGQSGGAAIHMVDTHPAVFDEFGVKLSDPNPYLYLHESTIINNWVSGEEAWFKAYGMSQVALTLKSGIETGIAPTGRSIINLMTDPVTALETEMINFILLTEPASGATKYAEPQEINQISGSEVIVKIGDYQVHRSFDFLGTDPRVSGGQFAFPLGIYSEWDAFLALITEFMTTYGQTQANANNLAQLAAFYGLTAAETINAYSQAPTYGGFRAAVEALYPTKVFPLYIEVLAPVPVFTAGYSVVIIQFAD